MNIEHITWIDSAVGTNNWEWYDKDNLNKIDVEPIIIHSFGVVLQETDTYVVLAQNYGVNPPQFCNTISIPKGCISTRNIIKGEINEK